MRMGGGGGVMGLSECVSGVDKNRCVFVYKCTHTHVQGFTNLRRML